MNLPSNGVHRLGVCPITAPPPLGLELWEVPLEGAGRCEYGGHTPLVFEMRMATTSTLIELLMPLGRTLGRNWGSVWTRIKSW